MIGVISREEEREIATEFFQLFKTPWEFYKQDSPYSVIVATYGGPLELIADLVVIYGSERSQFDEDEGLTSHSKQQGGMLEYSGILLPIYGRMLTFEAEDQPLPHIKGGSQPAGIEITGSHGKTLRIGYDLFHEVRLLLSSGQPPENAGIPTLDIHISMLRDWILKAGLPLLEIPPTPAGRDFMVCLTHDVDFVGISRHLFDYSMFGFAYRAVFGTLFDAFRRKIPWKRVLLNWRAALSVPLVHLGVARDFWCQFDRYLQLEKDLRSTFFVIPYRNKTGEDASGRAPARRSVRYDIEDIKAQAQDLLTRQCEIGLHGIDAWRDAAKGHEELRRISEATGQSQIGVRMHWLYFDDTSYQALERAGFYYDSTVGYNEAVGYRAGTMQAFRPLGVRKLLELPLLIQDSAMLYPRRMNLSEPEALSLCKKMFRAATVYGGVLTVNWHQRSLAPERLWGDLYIDLLAELRRRDVWFATANQVVEWFSRRRELSFDEVSFAGDTVRVRIRGAEAGVDPPLLLRIHHPSSPDSDDTISPRRWRAHTDFPWPGGTEARIPLRYPAPHGAGGSRPTKQ